MDITETINLIEKSEHVALALPDEPTLDCVVAGEVLASSLLKRGKKIGFLNGKAPTINHPNYFEHTLSQVPPPKELVVSIDTSRFPVSTMRYEKTDDRLDIIFSPESSSPPKDVLSLREGKTLCDLVIALGIPDIEGFNGRLEHEPGFFTEKTIINIDNNPQNKNYGEINLILGNETPVSELIYHLVSTLSGAPLTQENATLLLAGILQATDSFQKTTTSPDTLLVSSELMRLGAEYANSQDVAQEKKPLSLLQLIGRASIRSKLEPDKKLLWSYLTAEDFLTTGRSAQDISYVFQHLGREFPLPATIALLWQDTNKKNVWATLSGPHEILQTLQSKNVGLFQSPHLLVKMGFSTFREAEEHLASLLKGVL